MMRRSLFLLIGVFALSARALSAQGTDTIRVSLGDAARLAAKQNAQVAQAQARVEQARAHVTLERSSLLPQASAVLRQTANTINTATFGLDFSIPGQPPFFDPNGEVIGPVKLTDVRGRLTQTLFDLSALSKVRSANASVNAADAQLHAASERAGAGAATAYVQAQRAQQLLVSRQADVALAQELVTIAKEQLASGVGVRLDVTRAEAQFAAVNAQLGQARSAVARTNLALARAIGLPAGTMVTLADSVPACDTTAIDEAAALKTALQRRPELHALEAQVKASRLQGSAIRAERLPTVDFVGENGFIGERLHQLNTYNWGIQVSVPVFQGFSTRARAQEHAAQLTELESRRKDFEQQVQYEVRSALLDVRAGIEQVTAAQIRLNLAEQEVADARNRYQSGVANSADVVTASLRLTDARTAYTEALAAYESARVALATAEGNVTELQ